MPKLSKLEKSAQLLSDETEKTLRRVYALEYMLILNLEDTIRFIIMKLNESKRCNLICQIKIMDMMLEQVRQKHLKENEWNSS